MKRAAGELRETEWKRVAKRSEANVSRKDPIVYIESDQTARERQLEEDCITFLGGFFHAKHMDFRWLHMHIIAMTYQKAINAHAYAPWTSDTDALRREDLGVRLTHSVCRSNDPRIIATIAYLQTAVWNVTYKACVREYDVLCDVYNHPVTITEVTEALHLLLTVDMPMRQEMESLFQDYELAEEMKPAKANVSVT